MSYKEAVRMLKSKKEITVLNEHAYVRLLALRLQLVVEGATVATLVKGF